jgi:hypothetical protein
VTAVTIRGRRPADPVHDAARFEIEDQQAAPWTECAKDVGVDGYRIRQMMVDDATEDGIAAGFGEVRARDRALDDRDVRLGGA